MYSPSLGRFMQTDPIGYGDGPNIYAYAGNDPVNFVDPSGLGAEAIRNDPIGAAQTGLDVAGLAPGVGIVPDLLNAGISVVRGDKEGALLSAAAAIPILGQAATAGKALNRGRKLQEARPKLGSSGGEGAGKNFSQKTKDEVRDESGNTCVFCGVQTVRSNKPQPNRSNIDHAIPKSRGGNNTKENAQNTCQACNLKKGARTTEEFLKDTGS